jgi:glycosyltransferase involved in cell wall biosynthesis
MTESTDREDVEMTAPGALDRPAIGISAINTTADDIAGTVLRVNRNGFHVLLAYRGDCEAVELTQDLDVTPVDIGPENEDGSRSVKRELAEKARIFGFPGLLFHRTSAKKIDLEQSLHAIRRSEQYAIEVASADDTDIQVIVGVPAYNEEIGIGSVVLSAQTFADEVVVVDDGSTDETSTIARQAGATVIEHETNQGKGSAVRTLMEHAQETTCEALVLIDGDGQHIPDDIPKVVDPVLSGDIDLVIGSRYLEGGSEETPLHRRFGQRVLDFLTIQSSNTEVTDSQSGFRALSPAAIERIGLEADNFSVESEMIDAAAQQDLVVKERPVDVRYEGVDGQTQNPVRHGLTVATFMIQLIRDRHPLLFFGLPGIVVTAFGAAYGFHGFILYQETGQFFPIKVWVSGFLTLVGVLSLFIGLVLNSIANAIDRQRT